jgi:hypothetical protein
MNGHSEGFSSPVELLADFFGQGAKKGGQFTKAEIEERQAALFGYAYAVGKGIDSLVVRPGESFQRDSDAEFRWQEGATVRRLPVQLKRLPPTNVNARETLENLIKKAAVKSTGNDLLLAIHLDRAGQFKSVVVPKVFRVHEVCFWGWSKPGHAEIFVNSYEIGAATGQQWQVPFPPPGFHRK